jgi:hypothetical protein
VCDRGEYLAVGIIFHSCSLLVQIRCVFGLFDTGFAHAQRLGDSSSLQGGSRKGARPRARHGGRGSQLWPRCDDGNLPFRWPCSSSRLSSWFAPRKDAKPKLEQTASHLRLLRVSRPHGAPARTAANHVWLDKRQHDVAPAHAMQCILDSDALKRDRTRPEEAVFNFVAILELSFYFRSTSPQCSSSCRCVAAHGAGIGAKGRRGSGLRGCGTRVRRVERAGARRGAALTCGDPSGPPESGEPAMGSIVAGVPAHRWTG